MEPQPIIVHEQRTVALLSTRWLFSFMLFFSGEMGLIARHTR